jgi:transmembrane sensor
MSDIRKDVHDPIDEAVEWHLRLSSSAAKEEDWLAFECWLASDSKNREAYDRVEMTWTELDEAKRLEPKLRAALPEHARASVVVDLDSRRRQQPKSQASQWGRWAVAACVALLVIAPATYFAWPKSVTYVTAKGETRNIVLADGTKIRLNSASRISVALGKTRREVEMYDAEASFDVAKNPSRPFFVTVGDRQVRVVGTDFNILHHAGQMTVTLRRGVIDVIPHDAPAAASTVRLVPGQQLVHREGQAASTVSTVEPETAYAWQDGHLIYHNELLSDVVSDLNRYFTVPILAGGDTAALRFSGVLAIDSEDAVVQRLETFLPVVAERSDSQITLHRKSEN